jgi:hypothetical protein
MAAAMKFMNMDENEFVAFLISPAQYSRANHDDQISILGQLPSGVSPKAFTMSAIQVLLLACLGV